MMSGTNVLPYFQILPLLKKSNIEFQGLIRIPKAELFKNAYICTLKLVINKTETKLPVIFPLDEFDEERIRELILGMRGILQKNMDLLEIRNLKVRAERLGSGPEELPSDHSKIPVFHYAVSGKSVYISPPPDYHSKISESLLKQRAPSLFTANRLLTGFLYKKLDSLQISLEGLVQVLSHPEIQKLFNLLLKEKKTEQTMLAGWIQHHGKEGKTVLNDLSRNTREDILSEKPFNRLWADQSEYLILTAIRSLRDTGLLSEGFFGRLNQMLSEQRQVIFRNALSPESLSDLLTNSDSEDLIELTRNISAIDLAKSAVRIPKQTREIIQQTLQTDKQKELFKEDLKFAETLSNQELAGSRYKMMLQLLGIEFRKNHTGEKFLFFDKVLSLSPEDLNYLIRDQGLVKFSKAFKGADKKTQKEFLTHLPHLPRSIFRDIFSGVISYKEKFGKETAEKAKNEISQRLYVMRRMEEV